MSITSREATRADLLRRLEETQRRVGAHSVLLSDAVARLVGLNSTELKCLDLLCLSGPTTAGKLAAHTGLTTGAMTAVIDRLERAGYARRRRHDDDRRCVVVEARARALEHIEPLYRRLATAMPRVYDEFDDQQLTTIVEYLSRALGLISDHITWLQTQPAVAARPRRGASASAPRPAGGARNPRVRRVQHKDRP